MTIVKTLRSNVARLESSYEEIDEPELVAPVILHCVTQDDLQGARNELLKWRDIMAWRKPGDNHMATVVLTLLDRIGELEAESVGKSPPAPEPSFRPDRDEYTFSTSTHLSLLTAAVLRQKSQIRDLFTLVDRLSLRLG